MGLKLVPSFLVPYLTLGQTYDTFNLKPNEYITPSSLNHNKVASSGRFSDFLHSKTFVTDLAKVLDIPPCIAYEYLRQTQLCGDIKQKHFFDDVDDTYCYYHYEIKMESVAQCKSDKPVVQSVMKGSWYIILFPNKNLPKPLLYHIQKGITNKDPALFHNARFLVNSVPARDFENFLKRIRPENTDDCVDVRTEILTKEFIYVSGTVLDTAYMNLQTWKNYIQHLPMGQFRDQNTTNFEKNLKKFYFEIKSTDIDAIKQTLQRISCFLEKSTKESNDNNIDASICITPTNKNTVKGPLQSHHDAVINNVSQESRQQRPAIQTSLFASDYTKSQVSKKLHEPTVIKHISSKKIILRPTNKSATPVNKFSSNSNSRSTELDSKITASTRRNFNKTPKPLINKKQTESIKTERTTQYQDSQPSQKIKIAENKHHETKTATETQLQTAVKNGSPIATFNNTNYVEYFVIFDPKQVINPSAVDVSQFRNQNYLDIKHKGELRMLTCYLCKKVLQTNAENTLCQCYCATYSLKGFRYQNDTLTVKSSKTDIKYHGKVPEYKVILVGASGKGKSTLINGLASYSKHNTLKEAESNEMVPIIPINFRLLKKFKQYPVHIKTDTPDDDNEDFRGGGVRSTTQKPKRHLFNLPGAMPDKLTFIDTPGINDTRGHKMDDQNIEYIKRALIEAQYVHAVCFVLSANDIKMITSYETVLRRLLSLVPKDALKNVVFFFNSTRGTNYGIGDSIEPLMCIFKNLANYGYNVHFVDDNVFFFENDCFRYLCAAKCGHAYSQNISFEEFEESWEVNRKSYRRFVHYLSMLEPVNGTSFDRLDTASKWLAKFEGAFDRATFNKGHSDQISTLINVLKKESSLSVDEQLVLFTQLSYLLPADLHDSIQNYRNLRMAA